jgi:hypothetical protein
MELVDGVVPLDVDSRSMRSSESSLRSGVDDLKVFVQGAESAVYETSSTPTRS